MKRKTMGENPLDSVVPIRPAAQAATAAPERKQVKRRVTFHLPVGLMDRARNAVYWTPGLTMAGLAAEAIGDALDKLERKNGKRFQPLKADLKGGGR
jgi:hypothetical protein